MLREEPIEFLKNSIIFGFGAGCHGGASGTASLRHIDRVVSRVFLGLDLVGPQCDLLFIAIIKDRLLIEIIKGRLLIEILKCDRLLFEITKARQ